MPKEMKFHGILAVGRTKTDAINNYRLLALSKGATVQVDSERSISFVTQASGADGLFNPASGNMDLETDDSLMEQLDFQSNSSAEVEVNHLVCENGCGAHVVFDSEELVKYCPHCTSSLSESSDEDCEDGDEDESDLESESFDFESDSADDEDESSEDAGDESEDGESDDASSDGESEEESDEGAEDDKSEDTGAAEEEEMSDLTEDDGSMVIGDGLTGDGVVVAADSYAKAIDLFRANVPMSALSSDATAINVEYMVCASDECGAHVVSTDEIQSCPVCQSSVEEPDENTLSLVDDEGDLSEDTDEDEEESSEETSEGEGEGEAESIVEEGSEESSESADITAATVEFDLARSLSTDDVAALDVSYSSSIAGQSRWTAFVNGMPVAMASKSSVGSNADIFDTPSFGHAVLATAKISGVRKALSELGFDTLKTAVSVSAEVKHMVDAEVAEARAQIEKQQSEFKERFAAALATAAVGLNRGFYSDKKNPIKAALWAAMSSAGIRNPESLIDSVFKNHSDAYHKTLFDAASELISQPLEAQESISKAISGMSYAEVSASSDDLEHRLETFGTSVSSGTPASADAPKPADRGLGRQAISQAVQSLGRRGR